MVPREVTTQFAKDFLKLTLQIGISEMNGSGYVLTIRFFYLARRFDRVELFSLRHVGLPFQCEFRGIFSLRVAEPIARRYLYDNSFLHIQEPNHAFGKSQFRCSC